MDHIVNIKNRAWATSYVDYMSKRMFDEGDELKMKHFPESFFKYKQLSCKTLIGLEKKQIWLAEIESLNDPFECSLQFDQPETFKKLFLSEEFHKYSYEKFGFNLSKDEINKIAFSIDPSAAFYELCSSKGVVFKESFIRQLEIIQTGWLNTIAEMNKNLRITCFSERNDSLLMWSHYADQHQGICIEYDMKEEDEIRPFLQPVLYSEKIHKINTFDELTPLNHILASLFKSKDWFYEEEWRLTIIKRNDILPKYVDVPIPKAIYLGTRYNKNEDELKTKLMEIAKEQNIPVYQMKKHDTEYKLERNEHNLIS